MGAKRKGKHTERAAELVKRYTYRVFWSDDDQEFVATCLEFPSLSGMAETQEEALREVQIAVHGAIEWMIEDGDQPPEPLSLQKFKGNLTLRTTPEKHREIATRAAESHVSINQYILSKLG